MENGQNRIGERIRLLAGPTILGVLLMSCAFNQAVAEGKRIAIPVQSEQQFLAPGSKWAPDDGSRSKRRTHGTVWLVLPDGWSESDPVQFEFLVPWALPTFLSDREEFLGLLFIEAPRQRAVYDFANMPVDQLARKEWSVVLEEKWKDKGDGFLNKGVAKLFQIEGEPNLVFSGAVDLRRITAVTVGEFHSEDSFASAVAILRSLRVE